jgi:PTH1 family peptidyl-tRNA hydrolase
LVIHDDLALPLGTIRTRRGGSDGGNNGLKSLSQHLGIDTNRIRIGVWAKHHERSDKVDVVLGKLTQDEQHLLHEQLPTIFHQIDSFVDAAFAVTTHRYTP